MEHFVWNIDPEIFRIGNFGPRYYGLMFAIGFLVSYRICEGIWSKEHRSAESLSSLLVYVMVGTLLGARLGHCLFYDPAYYLLNPLEILMIWKGGLASHGGTLGVMLAVFIYQRKHPTQPYGWLADRLATVIPFGAGCIRVGNFFNSEIIGKPSDLPFAVIFSRVDEIPRHPAMLYEALSYFALFVLLMLRYRKQGSQLRPGSQIGIMLTWIFGFRILWEFFKENQVAFEDQMTFNMGQILSVPFVVVGVLLLTGLYRKWVPSGYGHLLKEDGSILVPELSEAHEPAKAKGPAKKKKK